MVLGACKRQGALAVADDEEARFLSDELLLDDNGGARRAESAGEAGGDRLLRSRQSLADHDAFAGRQAVRFDDEGRALRAGIGERVFGAGEMPIVRRRNAVLGADRLREGLRRFQLGGSRRGTEDCKSRVPQIVREAVHQWRFGANNDESDPRLAAECSHLRMIVYIRRTVPCDGKDAGVPRRAVKSFELRTLP